VPAVPLSAIMEDIVKGLWGCSCEKAVGLDILVRTDLEDAIRSGARSIGLNDMTWKR
jgi:hypothetical protein